MLASGPEPLLSQSPGARSAKRVSRLESRSDPAFLGLTEGAVQPEITDAAVPASPGFRRDGPAPFLTQTRAQSALRRELSAIAAELAPELDRRRAAQPDAEFEMHVLPHRLIARLSGAGISFSWIGASGGQSASVAEGRLLVIQWAGVESETRGVAALRSARPVRERVYCAEAADAEHWGWRAESAAEPFHSTAGLVAQWLDAL
jgi:hypothetical protein